MTQGICFGIFHIHYHLSHIPVSGLLSSSRYICNFRILIFVFLTLFPNYKHPILPSSTGDYTKLNPRPSLYIPVEMVHLFIIYVLIFLLWISIYFFWSCKYDSSFLPFAYIFFLMQFNHLFFDPVSTRGRTTRCNL